MVATFTRYPTLLRLRAKFTRWHHSWYDPTSLHLYRPW